MHSGNPSPQYARVLKADYGQDEAIAIQENDPRSYLVTTKKLVDDDEGHVKELHTCQVVWAINEGRGAAQAVDAYLMGKSNLPR